MARLITVFSLPSMVLLQHACVFFSEVPRIEELQDPDSSPRREEVGRPTLRDYGGFLLPFFYRARFQLFTLLFSGASKTTTQKPPDTLGILESTSPRKALHD